MKGKDSTLLQGSQGFKKVCLPVTGNIMIDIIASHRIKRLIHKIQMRGISFLEANVVHALRLCIFLT